MDPDRASRLRVDRHKIAAGEWRSFKCDGELFVHPLVGFGQANGQAVGGRRRIFDPFPGGILFDKDVEIKATTDFDVIVATCPTAYPGLAGFVTAKTHTIGSGTAKREVREILGADGPSEKLRCGETINRPGGWSSWPPHQFDRDDAARDAFEESFYVFTDPRDSYALITRKGFMRGQRVDDVVKAYSGTIVDVPLGEHPIVAAPGTRLIYCWFYVGADKHYAKWAEDLGDYK